MTRLSLALLAALVCWCGPSRLERRVATLEKRIQSIPVIENADCLKRVQALEDANDCEWRQVREGCCSIRVEKWCRRDGQMRRASAGVRR